MAKVLIEETNLTNIANAIRGKTGKTDLITPPNMATEIESIESGGGSIESGVEYLEVDSRGRLVKAKVYGDIVIHRAFYNCSVLTSLELPSSVTSIGEYAFYNCSKLALTELPSSVTSIELYAFYNCSKLALTELPSSVTYITAKAFGNCLELTNITFKSKPTKTIANDVFYNCTNLLTINVPWAEGEVANAPWGATNATINYNYTGE